MQLIIEKYGAKLSVKSRKFQVYADEKKQFFSPEQITHIYLNSKTSVTTDAMMLAVDHEIPVMILDHLGHPVCRIWSIGYGSISTIRKKQAYFCDSVEGLEKIKQITLEKIQGQHALIEKIGNEKAGLKQQIEKSILFLEKQADSVRALNMHLPNSKSRLRGFEGSVSKVYFNVLGKAVPESFCFKTRTRPAQDMFNAVLNYMYGMLYSHVEGAIIKSGMDPYMGIMHRDDYNKPVLVYDLIEPYRIWADTIALRLCAAHLIDMTMFTVNDEQFWLEREGKKIVIATFNDYMDVIIQNKHRRRSRFNHIIADITELAQIIKNNEFTLLEKSFGIDTEPIF